MTAQLYVHDILQPHVATHTMAPRSPFFQEDNVRHHTARVSHDCLHTVTTLPWDGKLTSHEFGTKRCKVKKMERNVSKTSYRTCMTQCPIVSHHASR
ncbi:hypothetical protein TNCV_4786311 [Trichonephila clavipes]|nr:hypothetical protein TNCV_4786311 [Trichonephila clavipes]